jgi:uroporphyrin-III C-methyltransferase
MNGKVYLVGAGPGDPDLLTVKALRLIRSADAVLHDDLVSPEVLRLIPANARVQNVGKRCGAKTMRQEEINFLMMSLASAGLQVVRLKSGDPLIFGRAGEEMEALRKANIEYEIVPGITSALGAAAAAGIPLTHRRVSSTLILTTGHRATEEEGFDWSQYAKGNSTLVIYMPGENYAEIERRLIDSGVAAETPCAIVSHATTPQQKVHRTVISDLHRSPRLSAPALLLVGKVAGLANLKMAGRNSFSQSPTEFESIVAQVFPTNERMRHEVFSV